MLEKVVRLGNKFLNPVPTSVGTGSIPLKVLWRYLTERAEREPSRPLGPFVTDSRAYTNPPLSGLRVTWFGHSSMLVEIDGARVLIDPVWEPRASPSQWIGPKRFFGPTLRLEELPAIDVVLLSHDHFDHFGAHTIRRLARLDATKGAQWVAPLAVDLLLRKLGVNRVQTLDWTESLQAGPLTITALPARHFSGRSLFNRFETLWASFVLAGAQHRVYYGADSGEWEGFRKIGETYGPFDLTMLEIGAFDPLWADIHMGPEGAVKTFRALGASGLLMPIHWGLFNLALHAWWQPIESISAVEGIPLWAPEPGVPSEVVSGIELRSGWWKR